MKISGSIKEFVELIKLYILTLLKNLFIMQKKFEFRNAICCYNENSENHVQSSASIIHSYCCDIIEWYIGMKWKKPYINYIIIRKKNIKYQTNHAIWSKKHL